MQVLRYKYRISKNTPAHYYKKKRVLFETNGNWRNYSKVNRAVKRKGEVLCVLTINLFIMKLVLQINNKIEWHFRSVVMTPFLSSMHSNCYIYLSYDNLQPTIFDSLGVLNLKMNRRSGEVRKAGYWPNYFLSFYGQTWERQGEERGLGGGGVGRDRTRSISGYPYWTEAYLFIIWQRKFCSVLELSQQSRADKIGPAWVGNKNSSSPNI